MRTVEPNSHVACARFYDHGSAGIRVTAPLTVSATLWRVMADRYEWVFTFTGDADIFVVDAILEHVSRLIGHTPGDWGLEFLASGDRADVLREVEHRFHDLRRNGVRQRVAVAPLALPEMRDALAKAGVADLANNGRLLH